MADAKISALGSASALDGTEVVPIVQGGATKKITANDLVGERLLSTTTVDLNTTSAQDLYTVPGGKTLIVTRAFAHSASGDLSAGTVSVEVQRSSDHQTILPTAFDTTNFTSGDEYEWSGFDSNNGLLGLATAASLKVQAKPNSAFGSPATIVVDLFGYTY